jgi:hypothetical protein
LEGIRGGNSLDGDGVTSLGAQVKQKLCNARLALGVLALRVDDPNLAEVDGSSESSAFGVARDVLDILDTATLHMR